MQRPVLSVIALSSSANNRKVLLQQRCKETDDTPYTGYLELPQGRIPTGGHIDTFAAEKLKNETGLRIVSYLRGAEHAHDSSHPNSSLYASNPFCCVADTLQNHFAISIVVIAGGFPRITKDAKGHRWYSMVELKNELTTGSVFPLNTPMLELLLLHAEEFELDPGLAAT